MENPLISVIVPVYNPGKYFNKCVESIAAQTYKRLEIILVDDGSTDGSAEMCDSLAENDSRIKVIHKENGGAASARNAGLDLAAGDFIAFVDADDYLDPDMYQIMLDEIIENKADAARCGIVREFGDGKTENWGSGDSSLKVVNKKEIMADIGEGVGILPVSPCNKLFKAECIGNIRFDLRFKFAEDTLFNFTVAQNINKMVYHDVNRYHYNFNSSSVTSKTINENNFDEHRVMDIIFTLADNETMPHCIKGDVLKSFRTIRQMILANRYMDRFSLMRRRIVSNKKQIFTLPIYSGLTKLRTLLLWLSPGGYKFAIKHLRK